MKINLITTLFLLFILHGDLFSQDTIYLLNPSFEDVPRKGAPVMPAIKNWTDCGAKNFPRESPPDIHPIPSNGWDVDKQPADGNTYLGLVTRYSDTYESVSQLLTKPIEAGKCYSISGHLALSKAYNSYTARSTPYPDLSSKKKQEPMPMESFANPVELLIWGGTDYCGREQLLFHSGPISNNDWVYYTFEFSPTSSFKYITIGAFFEYGYKEPYNGHILLDGLSPIVEIECK